jgi:peptidoglycan/LPS O-acetylase OafA/YrhL
MNLEQLKTKLIAAARTQPADDRVPYAFEQRILARLAAQPVMDVSALWARALWRAAVPCVVVTILLAALSFTTAAPETSTSTGNDNLYQQFEQTLFAPANQLEENW